MNVPRGTIWEECNNYPEPDWPSVNHRHIEHKSKFLHNFHTRNLNRSTSQEKVAHRIQVLARKHLQS